MDEVEQLKKRIEILELEKRIAVLEATISNIRNTQEHGFNPTINEYPLAGINGAAMCSGSNVTGNCKNSKIINY